MSIVSFDIEGDLNENLIRELCAQNYPPENVILFEPGNDSWVVPWNPFNGPGETIAKSSPFCAATKRMAESWGIQLDTTLDAATKALVEAGYSPLELELLLRNRAFRMHVVELVKDEYTRSFFINTYEALSDEMRVSWTLSVINKISKIVSDRRIRRVIGNTSSLDLRTLLDRKETVLLISLNYAKLQDGAHVLSELLVNAVWRVGLARADTPEESRPVTRVYCDEFQVMGSDNVFCDAIARGRKYGIHLVLAHQSQVQLSPELRQMLRNNCACKVYFSPGPLDATDLAKELAPMPTNLAYNQLLSLKTGECFVIRRGEIATRTTTPNRPKPKVSDEELAAYREASFRAHAIPVALAEQQLADRLHMIATLAQESPPVSVEHRRRPRKSGGGQ